ncbi:CLUMA_CG000265, isoform A [Clunio marinus]|uniref:CLUMA_CG000265, isoform A n=1 Tax=Clunio marinus TaxID=568069 RepID=A0A1J1HJ55_9DIPT|nr:CLUMA_CG000265, isoform A [Clunio marinus]
MNNCYEMIHKALKLMVLLSIHRKTMIYACTFVCDENMYNIQDTTPKSLRSLLKILVDTPLTQLQLTKECMKQERNNFTLISNEVFTVHEWIVYLCSCYVTRLFLSTVCMIKTRSIYCNKNNTKLQLMSSSERNMGKEINTNCLPNKSPNSHHKAKMLVNSSPFFEPLRILSCLSSKLLLMLLFDFNPIKKGRRSWRQLTDEENRKKICENEMGNHGE